MTSNDVMSTFPQGGVEAVDRAFRIVFALEESRRPMTLTEISSATDLYKSAVLRLMVSLERSGLIVRRADMRYVLGTLAFRLGHAFKLGSRIDENLLPIMAKLVAMGTESPSFHVRQDDAHRLCLLRLDSHHSTLDRIHVGDVLPLRKGAAGKVLSGPVGQGKFVDQVPLQTSFGERDPSCAAIAGPVFIAGGELLGSLSLSGPLERFACMEATRELGGVWPWR
jgi:DNA-binding IclR family transcriptional regulator